jgi:hypothetical protein
LSIEYNLTEGQQNTVIRTVMNYAMESSDLANSLSVNHKLDITPNEPGFDSLKKHILPLFAVLALGIPISNKFVAKPFSGIVVNRENSESVVHTGLVNNSTNLTNIRDQLDSQFPPQNGRSQYTITEEKVNKQQQIVVKTSDSKMEKKILVTAQALQTLTPLEKYPPYVTQTVSIRENSDIQRDRDGINLGVNSIVTVALLFAYSRFAKWRLLRK